MAHRFAIFVLVAVCLATATSMEDWKAELLQRENGHRADHTVAPLNYSPELEQGAQEWAEVLAGRCEQSSAHIHTPDDDPRMYKNGDMSSPFNGFGENIQRAGLTDGSTPTQQFSEAQAPDSANAWYNEVNDYPWPAWDEVTHNPKMIYHFTQMVWKGTKEVGYGMATHPGCGTTYIVARYFPRGNLAIQGQRQFQANVLPFNG